MSTETCVICRRDGTPWVAVEKGHMCEDCYYMATRKWISVKNKLPDKDGRYLVFEKHPEYIDGIFAISIDIFHNGKFFMSPTHWMNLPEMPDENEDN